MKKLSAIGFFLLFTVVGYAQKDPKALTVLDAMSAKYSKISAYKAKITSTLISEEDGLNEEYSGEITVKGDMFRLKMDEQEIYNDGVTVWTYLSDANEVNIDNYDPDEDEFAPSKVYNAYKKGYKYIHVEEAQENGKLCDVIDLIPDANKSSQFFKIKMFISQKDRSLVSWVMFEKSGTKYRYSISDFNGSISVKDDYFKFNKANYPNVEVIDLR
ncbi:MAG: outer membrane lipoprotein carrier protein LolA [Cyclobacteriaceae bacterium]|nr:outer membrane lipoprotein carrier protein LolA [Cyclobacteriaceae bacterium]